jgi:hypothetical protein
MNVANFINQNEWSYVFANRLDIECLIDKNSSSLFDFSLMVNTIESSEDKKLVFDNHIYKVVKSSSRIKNIVITRTMLPALVFKKIDELSINKFKAQAEKEGLLFSKGVTYYGLFQKRNECRILVGFCGIKFSKVPVFKNDYVLPDYRGNGYLKEMNKNRLRILNEMNFSKATANCTPMALSSHLHFKSCKIEKEFKNGITSVLYENISKH